jgi:hypothetical protein
LALWVLAGTVSADTVVLKTGGRIEGTISQIKIVKDGQTSVITQEALADVSQFKLEDKGDQVLKVEGSGWTGKIVEVRVRCLGGEQVFTRDKITSLEKKVSAAEKARAEYKARAEKLAADDAAGWLDLAVWAGQNQLKREQQQAAQQSLDIDSEHPKAVQAHRILGHVLKEGKWLTAAEAAKGPEPSVNEEEMIKQGKVKVGTRWVDPEEKERIEELKNRIQEMEESVKNEIDDWYARKKDDVQSLDDDPADDLKAAEATYARWKAQRLAHMGDGCMMESEAVQGMKTSKQEIEEAKAALARAKGKAGDAAGYLKNKAAKMKRVVHDTAIRLSRKIEAGDKVEEGTLEELMRPKGLSD